MKSSALKSTLPIYNPMAHLFMLSGDLDLFTDDEVRRGVEGLLLPRGVRNHRGVPSTRLIGSRVTMKSISLLFFTRIYLLKGIIGLGS